MPDYSLFAYHKQVTRKRKLADWSERQLNWLLANDHMGNVVSEVLPSRSYTPSYRAASRGSGTGGHMEPETPTYSPD